MTPVIVLFIGGVAVVIFFGVLITLFRGGSGSVLDRTRGIATETGEDGFWVISHGSAQNGFVKYLYWSGGIKHTGDVRIQTVPGGRQFVYTGVRPERVEIVACIGDGDESELLRQNPTSHVVPGGILTDTSSDAAPSAGSSGFPAAY